MGELGRGRPQFEVCAAPGTDAVARLLPGLGVSARGTYDRKGYTSHSSFGAKSARAKSLQWPVEALGERKFRGIVGHLRDKAQKSSILAIPATMQSAIPPRGIRSHNSL